LRYYSYYYESGMTATKDGADDQPSPIADIDTTT